MFEEKIDNLRYFSRKLVRELGMLELDSNDPNITPGHWHALIEIDKDSNLTVTKLGNLLLISNTRISRLTTYLYKRGLITYKKGLNDKREKYLTVTSLGKATIKDINAFSENKIKGAFKFLKESEMIEITNAIYKYSIALEQNRSMTPNIKIATLSTSRMIRKQIINIISEIQRNEFSISIDEKTNISILKAEQYFHYNNSCNFWYAIADDGQIIGGIGLRKINQDYGEIKKFFVIKAYRGTGVAKQLFSTLTHAAYKHGFKKLFLGTVDNLKAAHKFYEKYGFIKIGPTKLPIDFEVCELDSVFYKSDVEDLYKIILS